MASLNNNDKIFHLIMNRNRLSKEERMIFHDIFVNERKKKDKGFSIIEIKIQIEIDENIYESMLRRKKITL